MEDRNRKMARDIAAKVAGHGGDVYFVGGLVRDKLMGGENKDVDIEVHGVTPEVLEQVLDSLGERTEMGASFGIYGLRHYELDIAMPRMETATGRGHRDFAVFTDPFLGTEKAAQRRDFTINALMENVLTGEIVDHYGGREDLQKQIIRHVNDATFAEDPLRVLRAAQFAARFGFSVATETVALCRTMDVSALANERVMGELAKALLKASKPSVFFETLREMGQLSFWFPEVEALQGVEQDPGFHPEGDVWRHTMLVLDEAALLRDQAEYPLGLMLAALCHDFGKQQVTQKVDGRIRALGHEQAGLPLAKTFLNRLTSEVKLRKYVLNMVELHMRPNAMVAQHAGHKSFARLFDRSVSPQDLLLLARADARGKNMVWDDSTETDALQSELERFRELMARPFVRGADLVAEGFQPAQDFGDALAYAHKMRLAGVCKEDALRQTAAFLRQKRGQPKSGG